MLMKNTRGTIPTSPEINLSKTVVGSNSSTQTDAMSEAYESNSSDLPLRVPGIPEDFQLFETRSRFVQLCGPMYEKIYADNTVALGLLLDEQHLNQLDLAHGGILMTLADNAMGRTLSYQAEFQTSYVTLSMNSQFMQAAQVGDFIYAKPTVSRKGRRLVFLECDIHCGEKILFHASATFAVLEKKS